MREESRGRVAVAIGQAVRAIRSGEVDGALTGGSESLADGIGTIFHGFDAADACRKVVQLPGKPLGLCAVVLSLGFLVDRMSEMSSLAWFGILTALVVACAIVTELPGEPALLVLFDRDGDTAVRGGGHRAARAEVAAATGSGKP